MSLFDNLRTGYTGLRAASAGIRVTTQNVTNASTPGFTRRTLEQSVRPPVQTRGGLWVGAGVQVDRIGRAANPMLFNRVLLSGGRAGMANAAQGALSSAENLFETTNGMGLRESIDGFFDSLASATADPGDFGRRQEVLVAAGRMTSTIRTVGQGLNQAIAEEDDALAAQFDVINADLAEVADLNRQIIEAAGVTTPSDLADRRDQIITRLSDKIGASAHIEADGSATVLIGGHAAVSDVTARTINAVFSPTAPPRITISVGQGAADITQEVEGEVGGRIAARDVLTSWLGDLDALATGIRTEMNTRHAAGFTAGGTAGGALFTTPPTGSSAAGISVAITDVDDLAFASANTGLPGDQGNLTSLIAGGTAGVLGGKSFGAATTDLTSLVASDTRKWQIESGSADAAAADAEQVFSNFTGVDLDQEAVELVRYQAAFQAAAKVIQVTDDMLGDLMSIIR